MIRRAAPAVVLCLIAAPLLAAPVGVPVPPPVTLAKVEPPIGTPQAVYVQTRVFPRGASAPWHIHHGVEVAYQVAGETLFTLGTAPPQRLKAGQSVTIPRGTPHTAISVGKVPARLVITLVVDKDKPLREEVAALAP